MIYSRLVIKILNILDFFQQKKIIKLFNNKFSKPIVIFDVGAHYGETIKLFVKKLNVKKIYSFEASPKNFKILKTNVLKKKSENILIFNFGLGDKIGESYINQTKETSSSTINNLNINSKYFKKKLKILNIKDKDSFHHQIPIKLVTLDHFIEKNSISNIDLLKLIPRDMSLMFLKAYQNIIK